MGRVQALRSTPYAKTLSDEDLAALVSIADRQVFEDGTVIYREGDISDAFYVIISGEVALSSRAGGSDKYALGTLGPGATFGEMSLLSTGLREVTTKTRGTSELLVIRRTELEALRENFPQAVLHFLSNVSAQVGAATRQTTGALKASLALRHSSH